MFVRLRERERPKEVNKKASFTVKKEVEKEEESVYARVPFSFHLSIEQELECSCEVKRPTFFPVKGKRSVGWGL